MQIVIRNSRVIAFQLQVPYNYTVFPNYMGNFGQREVEHELDYYASIVDVRCYELAALFLCSVFVPKCGPQGRVVRPCRNLCLRKFRSFAIRAESFSHSLTWLIVARCGFCLKMFFQTPRAPLMYSIMTIKIAKYISHLSSFSFSLESLIKVCFAFSPSAILITFRIATRYVNVW